MITPVSNGDFQATGQAGRDSAHTGHVCEAVSREGLEVTAENISGVKTVGGQAA